MPSDLEWTTLLDYLDPDMVDPDQNGIQSRVAGGKMKESGLVHWNSPNEDATNESGWSSLPGGFRSSSGSFSDVGNWGLYWSSTEFGAGVNDAWHRNQHTNVSNVNRAPLSWRYGLSVRCLKD